MMVVRLYKAQSDMKKQDDSSSPALTVRRFWRAHVENGTFLEKWNNLRRISFPMSQVTHIAVTSEIDIGSTGKSSPP